MKPAASQSPLFADQPLPKAQRGAIYALGRHRLMCGDATDKAAVAALFSGCKPTLVVTSPPYASARNYNDPIHCWRSMAGGALDGHEFSDDVQLLVNLGVIHQKEELVEYWRGWLDDMRRSGHRLYAQYPWAKTFSMPGAFKGRLSPSHEFVFHLNRKTVLLNKWVKSLRTRNSRTLHGIRGKDGILTKRSTDAVTQEYKAPMSVISLPPVRFGEACGHPAQMPTALASFLIRTWKKEGCLTYDPFGGTATTLLACELEGARGLAMEISPAYCDMALARWRKLHPTQPITRVDSVEDTGNEN